MSGTELRRRSFAFALALLAVLSFSLATTTTARANDSEDAPAGPNKNPLLAQQLFEDALRRMERGDYHAACPMLERSQELDPASGTALDLGYCFEREGDLVRAFAAYQAARKYAVVDRRADREAAAQKKLDELGPKIAAFREATAAASAASEPLETGTNGESAPKEKPAHAPAPNARRTAAWATGIAGATFVVVGAISGIVAIDKHADVDAACDGMRCPPDIADRERSASTFAWGANIGIALGLVALGVSTYLFFTSSRSTGGSSLSSVRGIGARF